MVYLAQPSGSRPDPFFIYIDGDGRPFSADGTKVRNDPTSLYPLALERSSVDLLTLHWTVVHPITGFGRCSCKARPRCCRSYSSEKKARHIELWGWLICAASSRTAP